MYLDSTSRLAKQAALEGRLCQFPQRWQSTPRRVFFLQLCSRISILICIDRMSLSNLDEATLALRAFTISYPPRNSNSSIIPLTHGRQNSMDTDYSYGGVNLQNFEQIAKPRQPPSLQTLPTELLGQSSETSKTTVFPIAPAITTSRGRINTSTCMAKVPIEVPSPATTVLELRLLSMPITSLPCSIQHVACGLCAKHSIMFSYSWCFGVLNSRHDGFLPSTGAGILQITTTSPRTSSWEICALIRSMLPSFGEYKSHQWC